MPQSRRTGETGVNYVDASTSKPSDSFPGFMSIVTGATPRTMGIYYDVAYDRSLDRPALPPATESPADPATPASPQPATTTEYEEGIDIDQTKVNGGAPGAGLTDGGIASIDSNAWTAIPSRAARPLSLELRAHQHHLRRHPRAGGYTAWSDKHPAYSRSPARAGTTLDDFYSPEINSNVIALPGVTTPDRHELLSPSPIPRRLTAWTNSFQNIQCYDTLKVNAILNEIDGRPHGRSKSQVPTIFGMNFQAVSVGQKLIEAQRRHRRISRRRGHADRSPARRNPVRRCVDRRNDLRAERPWPLESTLLVITAKHGQSPIDPNRYFPIPGHSGTNGTTPATLLAGAGMIPLSESPLNPTGIGATEDDVSLLWLNSSSQTQASVDLLEKNGTAIGLGQIYSGPALSLNYNQPGLGPHLDPRTPDIIITPNVGVTYTGSTAKLMEHGGFAHDDTNVMLLVENPAFHPSLVSAGVGTNQVAPTILEALGLNPRALDAVRLEGTPALPQVPTNGFHH